MLLSLALSAPVAAHRGGAFWTHAKVTRAIDDKRIRVGTKLVRVDTDTTLCAGDGRGWLRHGTRRWMHFHCTFTTFTVLGADKDLEFRVHALDGGRMAITDAHWVG